MTFWPNCHYFYHENDSVNLQLPKIKFDKQNSGRPTPDPTKRKYSATQPLSYSPKGNPLQKQPSANPPKWRNSNDIPKN